MDRDKEIWNFMLREKRFFGFTEIKEKRNLHEHQLNVALKRLEKAGLVVKSIHFYKNRPVNRYLAINPHDPNFKVTICNIKWLHATIERTNPKDGSMQVFGVDLGDIGSYIREIDGELTLVWPEWITACACVRQGAKLKDET